MLLRMRVALISMFGMALLLPYHASANAADCDEAARLLQQASDIALQNPAEAEKKLRQVDTLCPGSAALSFNLAMVLYRQDKPNEAAKQLETAIKINPDYAKALNALAYIIYQNRGDYNRGKTLAERAVSLEPRNQVFKDTLELFTVNVDVPPVTKHHRPDAFAVVIGNKNYKNQSVAPVPFAGNDAATMKRYLVDSFGFSESNIFLLNDATLTDFVGIFGDSKNHRGELYSRVKAGKSDVFIYYSGHGAPDGKTNKAYLVPSDGKTNLINLTSYSLDTLYENLKKLSEDKNLPSVTVVLDTCFSGGYDGGMIIDASPIFIETSTPLLKAKNAVVFTSTKQNATSRWYRDTKHGLFTYFFLKNLKLAFESGRKITAADMEQALTAPESVNDVAYRLYNEEQQPQVFGNKTVQLVP